MRASWASATYGTRLELGELCEPLQRSHAVRLEALVGQHGVEHRSGGVLAQHRGEELNLGSPSNCATVSGPTPQAAPCPGWWHWLFEAHEAARLEPREIY